MAEGGGLLNRYTPSRRIEGSNPSVSAIQHSEISMPERFLPPGGLCPPAGANRPFTRRIARLVEGSLRLKAIWSFTWPHRSEKERPGVSASVRLHGPAAFDRPSAD